MQRRLAEELRSLNFAKHAHAIPTRPVPGGVGYRDSIQKVVGVSVAATSASLVFPSSGYSTASSPSISSAGSEVPTPSSGGGSYKILRVEAFRDLTEIASLMVNDGYTGGLITEFARGQRGSGGDAILGTWFSDLGVEWVLGANEMSLRELPWSTVEELIKKWVVALTVMAEALRLTWSGLCSDAMSDGGAPLISRENYGVTRSAPARGAAPVSHTVSSAGSSDPDQESPGGRPHPTSSFDVASVKEAMVAYSLAEKRHRFNFDEQGQVAVAGLESHFSVFAQASLMKMLGFPDAVSNLESSPEKILRMIDMYSLVNDISPGLLVLLAGESKKLVSDRIESVLETMGHAVRRILNNLIGLIQKEESWKSTVQPQVPEDIHPITQYVVTYINLLLENSTVLNLMMHGEDDMFAIEGLYHDSGAEDSTSLANIVGDLINTLDAMLEDRSKAYPAAGRRFIFLLNNANFVLQQGEETSLQDLLGAYWSEYRKRGIDRHIRSYLNASWEPVISCLASNKSNNNLMRGKNSVFRKVSVLVEFNSLLQITYRSEKLWKIKSPQLRSRVRKSVSAKVISAYKGYLESHAELKRSAINAPEDLEDMLQDLFVG